MRPSLLSAAGRKALMTRCLLLLLSLLLAGCAAAPLPAPPDTRAVFDDTLFPPPEGVPDARALFELTPAMRQHLVERIEPRVRHQGPARALLEALYTDGDLRLEYESLHTRTAAQAFQERRGNCLSLVLMTAAFARELGLPVRFHEVLGAPAVEHEGVLTFVVGHVNLALGEGPRGRATGDAWLVVDFLPGQDLARQQRRVVDERRIAAMFMNNRAAEALALGRLHEAHAWLRGAHAQDPGYAPLYNTLGVVYRQRGAWAQAGRALRMALTLDPSNAHAAGNLAALTGGPPQAGAVGPDGPAQRARLTAKQQKVKPAASPSTLQ
jgi:hypothetical protein